MSKEQIISDLMQKHEDEKICYTTCMQNGCWDAICIVRTRSKNGKLVAVEPGDSINPGEAREDIAKERIEQGMVQQRPCVMGHAWKKEMYAPTRITKPLKRIGGRGYGNGYFVEISWEEALDTIADKMKETIERFGPYSIFHTHLSFFKTSALPFGTYIHAGLASWGDQSTSGSTLGEQIHLGFDLVKSLITREENTCVGFEAPNLLKSNLIVLWGFDPVVGWHGSVPYYIKLAREKGTPVICIDPRYTGSAEVLADQWIPIRPGTDLAMLLAVAQVIYEEELWNKEYVNKYVDMDGFEKFRNYLMGGEDGEIKNPEWAEKICAVPAETIRAFARLYATSSPVHLQCHYSIAKRHLGDYVASTAMILQSMTGNLTIPGGCESGATLVTPPRMPMPFADFQRAPMEYFAPVCFQNNKTAEVVLMREKYDNGEVTEQEFRASIGCPPDRPLPNIQFIFYGNNQLLSHQDVNKRFEAASKVFFTCGLAWHTTAPTVEWMDIVLPAPLHQFESTDPFLLGQQRFIMGPSGMRNYFLYCGKSVDPPDGVRPIEWINTELAKRLGVVDKYNPRLKDVPYDKWDEEVEKIYREGYERWAKDEDGQLKALGIEPKPWEEFLKDPIVRIPIDEPYYPFKNPLAQGGNPFKTISGKIEFSSKFVETGHEMMKEFGGKVDSIPRWQPTYMNEPAYDSFYHPRVRHYPLSMVTPVSLYRMLSCNDPNPLLRDCYKHRVWLNPADAKARGIKDNDQVIVYNEYGEMILNTYVTSKVMPGTTAIHFGAWYKPNAIRTERMKYGIDMRGAVNFLIGDKHLPHVVNALLTSGLVEVKKFGGEE